MMRGLLLFIATLGIVGALGGLAWAQSVEPEPAGIEEQSGDRARAEAELADLERQQAEIKAQNEALRAEQARLRAQQAEASVLVVAKDEVVPEVVAFGQDVEILGQVEGDVVCFGGNVRIAPGGNVGGSAVSFGGRVHIEDGGEVIGNRVTLAGSRDRFLTYFDPSSLSISWPQIQWRLVLLLSAAGAGMLLVGLFPNRVGRIARDIEGQPQRAVGLGIIGATVSVLVVGFSVLFTALTLGLGLPVSALLLCGLGIAWLFGFVGLCQAVGDRLPFQLGPQGRWLGFLAGILLISLFAAIPWVGGVVIVLASCIGVGASVTTRFGSISAAPLAAD